MAIVSATLGCETSTGWKLAAPAAGAWVAAAPAGAWVAAAEPAFVGAAGAGALVGLAGADVGAAGAAGVHAAMRPTATASVVPSTSRRVFLAVITVLSLFLPRGSGALARPHYHIVTPASMLNAWPVTTRASSEAR